MSEPRSMAEVLAEPLTLQEMKDAMQYEDISEIHATLLARAAGFAVAEAIAEWLGGHWVEESAMFAGSSLDDFIAEAKEG